MVKSVVGGFEKMSKHRMKPSELKLAQESIYREGKKKKKSWDRSSRDNKYKGDL